MENLDDYKNQVDKFLDKFTNQSTPYFPALCSDPAYLHTCVIDCPCSTKEFSPPDKHMLGVLNQAIKKHWEKCNLY